MIDSGEYYHFNLAEGLQRVSENSSLRGIDTNEAVIGVNWWLTFIQE